MKIPFSFLVIFSLMSSAHAESVPAERTRATERQIGHWLDLYWVDCGQYPSTAEGLQALIEKPAETCAKWGPVPYAPALPLDGWNQFFLYTSQGKSYTLKSLGADGREGGVGEDTDIAYSAGEARVRRHR